MAPQTSADLAAAASDAEADRIPEQVQMGAPPPLSTEADRIPEQVQMGAPPPLSTEAGGGLAGPGEALKGGAAGDTPSTRTSGEGSACGFSSSAEDTIFIFDWDDTVLPSTWVQSQGLRLDDSCEVTPEQWEQLQEVADNARETIMAAKRHGHVVLVTNAERGWIELSCAKFMPTLACALEDVRLISARTTYESEDVSNPLDWKVLAFENEIRRIYADRAVDPSRRKNVFSLGDSLHEREALLRVTSQLPNCRSKSLKFVERPDISQIVKQHALVTSCFDRIVHHDGNLDLCIKCGGA